MNTPTIINKIELTFWDHAIPLMSESKTVQSLVKQMYVFTQSPRQATWIPAAVLASAFLGLGMGYIIGIFGAVVR